MQRKMFTVSPMFRVTFATAGLALVAVLALVGVLNLVSLTAADPVEASSANISQDLQGNADLGKLTEPFASPLAATAIVTGTTTFTASPNKPGSASSYTTKFVTVPALTVGTDKIILHFDKDFQFPATLDRNQITISSTSVTNGGPGASDSVNPQTVIVNFIGTENNEAQVTLTVPDMVVGDVANISAGPQGIGANTTVTVTIQQGAGVKNPTEGGAYDFLVSTTQETTETAPAVAFSVPFIVELSAADGSRGENLTLVGLGFKNFTTVTFWRDADGDGTRDTLEIDLCNAVASTSDIATCDFSVSNPPFLPRLGTDCVLAGGISGCNFINAVDGRDNTATIVSQADIDRSTFDLRGSVIASPSEANPGDTITIQLKDFPPGETLTLAILGGVGLITTPVIVAIDGQGEANFTFKIPDAVAPGVQTLAIATATSTTRRTTMIIGSADLLVTPSTVVANQRVSIIGSGFTDGGSATVSTITIGGETVHSSKINDGATVSIDAGGSFSTSIDLPVTSATTVGGPLELKVRDSGGRDGTTTLTFLRGDITINPVEGRVSTNVTVTGTGFPAKNNDGNSVTIEVTYDAGAGGTNTATATPDSGGNWQVTLQVPSDAAIPSTNVVRAEFDLYVANTADTKSGIKAITTATHRVPRAVIALDQTSGPVGIEVELTGAGFRRFTFVNTLKVGGIDVTPSPKPATDDQGGLTFTFNIPSTDIGVQTVELDVGGTTASVGFTITELTGIQATPSFGLHQDPLDGATGLKVDITQVTSSVTGSGADVLLGAFQVELTYDGTCLNILALREMDFPIIAENIKNEAGVTTFNGFATEGVAAPLDLGHALTRVVGNVHQHCAVAARFVDLRDLDGNIVVVVPSNRSLALLRGDARPDGAVNIADALFIAQYLVGSRPACTLVVDTTCLHSVNAASVRRDGEFDRKTIADALFIAQYLVGLRDENYNLIQ